MFESRLATVCRQTENQFPQLFVLNLFPELFHKDIM